MNKDFYVDDALTSRPTVSEAVSLMKQTQKDLSEHGLLLHKVASNKEEVLQSFSPDQRAKNLEDIDLCHDILPVHRSLGLHWDLNKDTFFFNAPEEEVYYL